MIKWYHADPEFKFERATDGASGYDVVATFDWGVIQPGSRRKFETGLHLSMPKGIEAQIRSRSGLSLKNGIIVLNAPGTVDSDYRGDVSIVLQNHGANEHTVRPNDRIAQVVFAPVFPEYHYLVGTMSVDRVSTLEALGDTNRGIGGFGSTGR